MWFLMLNHSGKSYVLEYGSLLLFVLAITTSVLSVLCIVDGPETIGLVFLIFAGVFWLALFVGVALIIMKNTVKTKSTKTETQIDRSSRTSRTTYLQPDLRLEKKTTKQSKKVISLKTEISLEESSEKLCAICKLPIRKGQEISICPYCESIFHKEHLSDWLELADDCPVCNTKLKVIMHR